MNLLNDAFLLAEQFSHLDDASLIPLPRKVAQELVMCAVLSPLMLSDIAVDFDEMIYALKTEEPCVQPILAEILSVGFREFAGQREPIPGYNNIHPPLTIGVLLKPLRTSLESRNSKSSVGRPLAFSFEFIEIFAGSSRISKALLDTFGYFLLEEFDLTKLRVLSWIFHLIESGRLFGVALEPPLHYVQYHAEARFEESKMSFWVR